MAVLFAYLSINMPHTSAWPSLAAPCSGVLRSEVTEFGEAPRWSRSRTPSTSPCRADTWRAVWRSWQRVRFEEKKTYKLLFLASNHQSTSRQNVSNGVISWTTAIKQVPWPWQHHLSRLMTKKIQEFSTIFYIARNVYGAHWHWSRQNALSHYWTTHEDSAAANLRLGIRQCSVVQQPRHYRHSTSACREMKRSLAAMSDAVRIGAVL